MSPKLLATANPVLPSVDYARTVSEASERGHPHPRTHSESALELRARQVDQSEARERGGPHLEARRESALELRAHQEQL